MKIKQKDIDIYAQYHGSAGVPDRKLRIAAAVLPVILTAAAIWAAVTSITEKISSVENDLILMDKKIADLQKNGIYNAYDDIMSAPHITSELISEIEKSKNISVESLSYNSENYSLEIICHSGSAADISEFIGKLRECGLYSDIVYSGYQTDEKGFAFTAVCVIGQEDNSDE